MASVFRGNLLCDDMYTAFGIENSYHCQINDDHGPEPTALSDIAVRGSHDTQELGVLNMVCIHYSGTNIHGGYTLSHAISFDAREKDRNQERTTTPSNHKQTERVQEPRNPPQQHAKRKITKDNFAPVRQGTLHQPPPFCISHSPSAKIIGKITAVIISVWVLKDVWKRVEIRGSFVGLYSTLRSNDGPLEGVFGRGKTWSLDLSSAL